MTMSSRVADAAHANIQKKAGAAEHEHGGAGRALQLKKSLVGKDFASQEAALSPQRGGVQMKDARTGGAWTLEELGTAPGQNASGAKDGGKSAAPIGPSVEQIVQDAYTLGGKSRYQVTPQEAMRWIEDMMRGARPEHKYAFIEAMKRVNRRL